MPSACATFVRTTDNPSPKESGKFCFRNSSNITKAGNTTVGTPGDPPPPPPEKPGTLCVRGSNDFRSSSDFTKSGNPYVFTKSSNAPVARSGKLWFSNSTNLTKSDNSSVATSGTL
jgi:hypothetical protein